ncbi:hypothetical protein MTO96_033713 [Rhipicephalus appendiculatus]
MNAAVFAVLAASSKVVLVDGVVGTIATQTIADTRADAAIEDEKRGLPLLSQFFAEGQPCVLELGKGSEVEVVEERNTLWPREVHPCAKCGDCFSSELSLAKHHRLRHPEKLRGIHCCSQCDYSTSIRSRLSQHMLTHTAERPFVCEMCHKDFTWRSDLTAHLITHTQERPYECPECGQRFNCLSHMNRHRKSHSRDPRPHVCPHCGKCYARRDYLKVHVTTHETERRHPCPACGRRFTDPSNARHHYNFVHLKKYPLSCPHCGKGFPSRRDVRRHVLVEHEGQEK